MHGSITSILIFLQLYFFFILAGAPNTGKSLSSTHCQSLSSHCQPPSLVKKKITKRCKCTFSSYILAFFHFGSYILILPLLVPKPINTCYFHPFRQSTDENS